MLELKPKRSGLALEIWQEITDSAETLMTDDCYLEDNNISTYKECWHNAAIDMVDGLECDHHVYYQILIQQDGNSKSKALKIANEFVNQTKEGK